MRLNLFLLFSVLWSICSLPGCGSSQDLSKASDRIKVVATIYPLADFVRNVGGARVEVMTLLPPRVDPPTFAPSPHDLIRMQGARLFVKIGLGFESWSGKLVRTGAVKELLEVDTSRGVRVIQGAPSRTGQGHTIANPHIWLDPVIAMKQVRAILEALVRLDPAHKVEYEKNAEAYQQKLHRLDLEIRRRLRDLPQRAFVSLHPSWSYFAREYGLTETAVIETSPGREPAPGDLLRIIRVVRKLEIPVILAEPQLNLKPARILASETGARIVLMDPVGSPHQADRSTYLRLMEYNLDTLLRGVRGEGRPAGRRG